jgi:hypothetical protein
MFSQTQKCKDQELEKEVVSVDSGNRGLKKKEVTKVSVDDR